MTHPHSLCPGEAAPQRMAPTLSGTPSPWASTSLREGRASQQRGIKKSPQPSLPHHQTGNSWDGPTLPHPHTAAAAAPSSFLARPTQVQQIPVLWVDRWGQFPLPCPQKGQWHSLLYPLLSTSGCNELLHGFRNVTGEQRESWSLQLVPSFPH